MANISIQTRKELTLEQFASFVVTDLYLTMMHNRVTVEYHPTKLTAEGHERFFNNINDWLIERCVGMYCFLTIDYGEVEIAFESARDLDLFNYRFQGAVS